LSHDVAKELSLNFNRSINAGDCLNLDWSRDSLQPWLR
jgi:hypothetical protein